METSQFVRRTRAFRYCQVRSTGMYDITLGTQKTTRNSRREPQLRSLRVVRLQFGELVEDAILLLHKRSRRRFPCVFARVEHRPQGEGPSSLEDTSSMGVRSVKMQCVYKQLYSQYTAVLLYTWYGTKWHPGMLLCIPWFHTTIHYTGAVYVSHKPTMLHSLESAIRGPVVRVFVDGVVRHRHVILHLLTILYPGT